MIIIRVRYIDCSGYQRRRSNKKLGSLGKQGVMTHIVQVIEQFRIKNKRYFTPLFLILLLFPFLTSKALASENGELSKSSNAKQKIELQCGQHTVSITCGNVFNAEDVRVGRQCNDNILSFTGPDGKIKEPPPPKSKKFNFYGKTPVGLGCDKAKDGQFYVEVDYSTCLENFNTCITTHLFTSAGERLTADMSDRMSQLRKAITRLGIPYPNTSISPT